jgi:hypothetical protein
MRQLSRTRLLLHLGKQREGDDADVAAVMGHSPEARRRLGERQVA